MTRFGLACSVAALFLAGSADAAVVIGPKVNGITTFTDTTTGLNWARLDNFFAVSYNDMAAAVSAAGFTVAVRSEVEALLGTLPLGGGAWAGYAAVMGDAPNRELIWGSFGPVIANRVGWAFAFSTNTVWTFTNSAAPADLVQNGGTDFADMNIWAYTGEGGTGTIPEPATWAMLIAGFGLVGAAARRRRSTAVTA